MSVVRGHRWPQIGDFWRFLSSEFQTCLPDSKTTERKKLGRLWFDNPIKTNFPSKKFPCFSSTPGYLNTFSTFNIFIWGGYELMPLAPQARCVNALAGCLPKRMAGSTSDNNPEAIDLKLSIRNHYPSPMSPPSCDSEDDSS